MARKGKPNKGRSPSKAVQSEDVAQDASESIEEAAVISEISADVDGSGQGADAQAKSEADIAPIEDNNPVEENALEDVAAEASVATDQEATSGEAELVETSDATDAINAIDQGEGEAQNIESLAAAPTEQPDAIVEEPVAPVAPPPANPKKRGGMSALLGGVLAAGLGGGAVYVLGQDGMPLSGAFGGSSSAAFEAAANEREAFRAEIAALQASIGAEVESALSGRDASVAEQLDLFDATLMTLSQAIEENARYITELGEGTSDMAVQLTERMTELEQLPFSEAVSETALAAYEAELANLIASVEEARAELSTQMADSNGEIQARTDQINQLIAEAEASRQEAAQLEEAAARARDIVNARAELTKLRVALDEGAPYASLLEQVGALSGAEVAPALADHAASGITAQGKLEDAFPDLARAALAAARASGEGADNGDNTNTMGARMSAFLDNRFQTRSLEPQEGTSTNAILSRVEAAVGDGDLAAALTEIETLSEVARAPLAEWIEQATLRRDALSALEALDAQLTSEQG